MRCMQAQSRSNCVGASNWRHKKGRPESRPTSHAGRIGEEMTMALYMYQFSYTPESWAAQLKKPENRVENVGRALCEAAGGKLIGAWLCFGEYDAVLIADMPDAESWSAVALAVTAGGAIRSGKTTALMSGSQGVEALKKAEKV